MELPEDVLRLVREYAKPLFRFVKEYNHAMRVLGKKGWPVLKDKLHTDPEQVLPALLVYQDAYLHKMEVYRLRDLARWCRKDSYPNDLHNQAFYATRSEEDAFWGLVRILYGDRQGYWDFREDTR